MPKENTDIKPPAITSHEITDAVKRQLGERSDAQLYISQAISSGCSFANNDLTLNSYVIFQYDKLRLIWLNHVELDGKPMGPSVYTLAPRNHATSTSINRFLSALSYIYSARFTSGDKLRTASSLPLINGNLSQIPMSQVVNYEYTKRRLKHISKLDSNSKRALAYLRTYRDSGANIYTRYMSLAQAAECLGIELKGSKRDARNASAHTVLKNSKKGHPLSDPDDPESYAFIMEAESKLTESVHDTLRALEASCKLTLD